MQCLTLHLLGLFQICFWETAVFKGLGDCILLQLPCCLLCCGRVAMQMCVPPIATVSTSVWRNTATEIAMKKHHKMNKNEESTNILIINFGIICLKTFRSETKS